MMKKLSDKTYSQAITLRLGALIQADSEAEGIAELTLDEQRRLYFEQHDIQSADRDFTRAFSGGGYEGIVDAGLNQVLGTIFDGFPQEHKKWVNPVEIPGLKGKSTQIEPSEPQSLNANDPYPSLQIASRAEDIAANRTGNKYTLSFELWQADETGMITAPLRAFAGQAVRAEEKKVIEALELNGSLDDGDVCFLAKRNNLLTTTAFSEANFKVGIQTLRELTASQTKAELLLQPGCLLVPPTLEGEARKQRQIIFRDSEPLPKITVSNYLSSTSTWFLFCDKRQADVVVLTFLKGQRKPSIVRVNEFETDGIAFRFRHIVGAKLVGYSAIKATA